MADDTLPPLPKGASMDSMPPLPQGASMDAALPLPKGATQERQAPGMDLTQKEDKKSLWERTKDVATESGVGGVVGFFTPELLTGAGMAASAFPLTAPAGPPLMYLGQMARGARFAEAGLGALAGGGGEVAAQTSEAAGQSRSAQEAWRLAGGVVTPTFANSMKYVAGKLVGLTGVATKTDVSGLVSAMAKDAGIPEEKLSGQQRKYLEGLAERMRGGAKSEDFAKQTYSRLEQGAEQIVDNYNFQAKQLENQADAIVKAAETAKAGRVAGAQQQATALQAQFESASKNLKDLARQRAANILKNADALAAKNRSYVANQSQSVRQIQEIDIQAMLKQAQTEAQNIINDAARRSDKLRDVAQRTAARGEQRMGEARSGVSAVGQAQTPTQTGTSIRDTVMPIFENLKKVRADNATKNKGDAFSFALQKEQAGQRVEQTSAFGKAMKEIDGAITSPETGLTNAPVDAVKNQLLQVKRALDPRKVDEATGTVVGKPVSFEGLETLRRFLRDRSYGLPAEGFDAIGQQQAGKLADAVEQIQREFSPSIGKFLEQYKADSEPLRAFKTKLGEAVVGKEQFDMGRFASDPAGLASKFFKTETGVKDLVTLLGGDAAKAETIARGYVGDQLRSADSKLIQRKIVEWRDWLPQFPRLQAELTAAEQRLAQAERTGGKREKLTERLRTEARELPGKASEAASKLETDVLEAGKKRIVEAAETQGKAEVAAAEKEATRLRGEAKKLSAEGERIKSDILGKKFDVRRVEQIILGGDKNLWKEIGPIVAADPQAKEATAKAISQVLAEKAPKSPRAVVEIYQKDIRPAIESTGIMDARGLAALDKQIDEIRRTVDPTQREKLTATLVRALRYGLITEAARVPSALMGQ